MFAEDVFDSLNLSFTFIRAVVRKEGSCAPEIFHTDFYVFI